LLKLFLFFPFLAFASELYTLPQESNHFINSYTNSLQNAEKEIYIFTQSIHEYNITKVLKKLSKEGIHIYILTNKLYLKESEISYLSLLKNIDVYTFEHKEIQGSLTCIDDKEVYLSSQDLNYKHLRQDHAFVLYEQRPCRQVFIGLTKNALKII